MAILLMHYEASQDTGFERHLFLFDFLEYREAIRDGIRSGYVYDDDWHEPGLDWRVALDT